MTGAEQSPCEPIRWDALTPRRREDYLRAARAICKRERPRLSEKYGPHVITCAPGFRNKSVNTRDNRRSTWVMKELVIRVVVTQKLAADQFDDTSAPIPDCFSIKLKHGKTTRSYRIPTDVDEAPTLSLQANRCVRVTRQDSAEEGSICCLVRDSVNEALFMLSCKHVFGMMKATNRCAGSTRTTIDQRNPDFPGIATIDRVSDMATIHTNGGTPSLDAAIARVTNTNQVSSTFNGRRAVRVVRRLGDITKDMRVTLPARSGTYSAIIEQEPIPNYVANIACAGVVHRVFFPHAIEYRRVSGVPQFGDSGSALLNTNNELVGMHFARRDDNMRGVAMLALDIFKQGVFGRSIKLEPNHR